MWRRLLLLVGRVLFIATWPLLLSYLLFIAAIILIALHAGAARGDSATLLAYGVAILLAAGGMIAGVIWCVVAYCRYALAVPACVVEKLPVKRALVRSRFLGQGDTGRIFGVYLLTVVIQVGLASLFQAPLYRSIGASLSPRLHLAPAVLAWLYGSQFLGTAIAGPVAAIAMAVVYYDERVRKEAFDLELMMESLPRADSAQAASA